MEPFSIFAFAGYVGARVASFLDKLDARDEYDTRLKEFHRCRDAFELKKQGMLLAIGSLGERRVRYLRQLLARVIAVAKKLEPAHQPFDTETGWFDGRCFDDIDRIVLAAQNLRPHIIDTSVSWSALGLLLAQGVELLDKFELAHVPVLHETVRELGTNALPDWISELGLADTPIAELLSEFFLFYGVFRIGYNFYRAEEAREAAKKLLTAMKHIGARGRKVARVQKRAEGIHLRLADSSYEAFKWTWITEKMLSTQEAHSIDASIVNSFANASRTFWADLAVPLLDDKDREPPRVVFS